MNIPFNPAGSTKACIPAFNKSINDPACQYFYSPRHRRAKYNVPLNISETDTEYVIDLYATGFLKEHISIKVIDDTLYIKGNKPNEESRSFTLQEFPIRIFERTLFLNGMVDTDHISAKSKQGVLIIRLPKTIEAQSHEKEIFVS